VAVRLVVEGDPVQGTDKHTVMGQAKNPSPPPPTVPYQGVGSFTYEGAMRERLSDLVRIDGAPVALTTSKSRLNVGEDVPLTGRHSGAKGSGFDPAEPAPITDALLKITDPIGEGAPSADAGSGLVSVGGHPVLLDGDAIDTCDGLGGTANSTVTSSTQDFVRASE
jgi:uncharacterized Zn-binding protein involved in type VI secretion